MGREIEVELNRVLIREGQDPQQISVREKDGERGFPIAIGWNEVLEIHRKLTGAETPRPMTHDLCGAILKATGTRLVKGVISDLRKGTFFATLHLETQDGRSCAVDARPSDVIALVLQFAAPLYVDEKVFERLEQP